jgi:alkane 1-monooxygenase
MNLFILAGIWAIAFGGPLSYSGLIFSFFLIGYVDELFGDISEREIMPPIWYCQLMLFATLPLLLFATLMAFNVTAPHGYAWLDAISRAAGIDPDGARARTHHWLWFLGPYVSLGMYYGAAGVNVSHELIHRMDKPFDRLFGTWLLAFTWDTGFAIEHVYGHHRNVGTELDPATARRGEYIIAFVYRSTVGQWLGAKRTEDERLARKGLSNNLWSNRFWRNQWMTLAVAALYVVFMGWWGVLLFIFAGSIGKIYLEVVNYIEHYGLVRIPGTRVEARHSWDSHRRVSGGMFYNLMLHANHHKIATRRGIPRAGDLRGSEHELPDRQRHDQRDHQQHQEDVEQDLRDPGARGRNAGEAEQAGDDRDDEKDQRPFEHRITSAATRAVAG